jgi:hypothetical protein
MLDFQKLWDAYPQDWTPCRSLSNGVPNFENQCAIRMGVALSRCGFKFNDFNGEFCWFHPEFDAHILRVEELLRYLKKKLPKETLTIAKRKYDEPIESEFCGGRQGIIVFQNFWGSGNQGDHIDLINEEGELKSGEDDYFERSERVYFWDFS